MGPIWRWAPFGCGQSFARLQYRNHIGSYKRCPVWLTLCLCLAHDGYDQDISPCEGVFVCACGEGVGRQKEVEREGREGEGGSRKEGEERRGRGKKGEGGGIEGKRNGEKGEKGKREEEKGGERGQGEEVQRERECEGKCKEGV